MYENCEAVNTRKQSFRATWPYYYIELLIVLILSQSRYTKITYIKYIIYIHYYFQL